MNPSDSKKLDEIDNTIIPIDTINKMIRLLDVQRRWLISKVKEQDREITELRARLPGTDAPWTLKELDDAKARIAEQDREIERHLDRSVQLMAEKHYQRRHRKWALEEARTNLHDLWWVQESQTHKDKQRAEKAEAELADCKAVYEAHATEAEKQIDELQAELANIREANRGMLYVINELQAELSACKERVGELEEAIIAALGLLESPEILDRIAVETLNKALQAQEQREGE